MRSFLSMASDGAIALLKEIPDHAPFRGKFVNTGLVRQTWGMSLFGPM